jgi:hypothetical protein
MTVWEKRRRSVNEETGESDSSQVMMEKPKTVTSTRSCVLTSPCLAAQSTGSFLAGVQTTTVHG